MSNSDSPGALDRRYFTGGRKRFVMDMHVEQRGPTESVLHLRVGAEEMDDYRTQARRKLARQAQVPGFRKGKVPHQVVEAIVGAQAIQEEAQRAAATAAYVQAIQDSGLQPYGAPRFEEEHLDPDGSLRLRVAVVTTPQVVLGEYRGLPATRSVTRVTDEHVATELGRLQEQAAEYETIADEPLQPGDLAIINYELFVDGERREGAGAEGYPFEVGSDRLFGELNQGLEGARASDHRAVTVSFPPDYHDAEIAGKSGEYRIEVVEVKRRRLPALDDTFAQQVSKAQTLDELRETIRRTLATIHRLTDERALQDQLIEQAVTNAQVTAPAAMVERGVDRRQEQIERELGQRGLTLEDYLQQADRTLEQLREDLAPEAETAVRRALVLDAIGRAEGIEVSQEEVDREVERMADRLDDRPERLRRTIDRGEQWEEMKDGLYFDKVIDFLVSNAAITEEQVESKTQDNA